jgi:hypothetical protein
MSASAPKPLASSPNDFESDLPSVAAQAALELDQLALNRPIGFSATEQLVRLISDSVTDVPEPAAPNSLLNPLTAVALGKAIDEALYAGQPTTTELTELIRQAARFKGRLAAMARNPEHATAAEREELRNVCIALSRQAAAVDSADRYRQEHPFKNYVR